MHSGDDGSTQLGDGSRVRKDELRVVACGVIDELNAHLGLAGCVCTEPTLREGLQDLQRELFAIGAVLADPTGAQAGRIGQEQVGRLEGWIDQVRQELPKLEGFILPAGSEAAVRLHVARTVCRRAERAVVSLAKRERVPSEILAYLNRLSDLLFAWARLANHQAGLSELGWSGC